MPEKAETTHFSVVDKWGNAVSNTYTINGYFGSGVVADGTGIVLNDEMDDFVIEAGRARTCSAWSAAMRTRSAPRKRPLSSMTPTILTKDNKVVARDRHAGRLAHLHVDLPGDHRTLRLQHAARRRRSPRCVSITSCCRRTRSSWSRTIRSTANSPSSSKPRATRSKGRSFNGDMQMIRIDGTTPEPAADPRGVGVGA